MIFTSLDVFQTILDAANNENFSSDLCLLIQKCLNGQTKGQLISKGIFVSSIHPKNELENVNFCPSLLTVGDTGIKTPGQRSLSRIGS